MAFLKRREIFDLLLALYILQWLCLMMPIRFKWKPKPSKFYVDRTKVAYIPLIVLTFGYLAIFVQRTTVMLLQNAFIDRLYQFLIFISGITALLAVFLLAYKQSDFLGFFKTMHKVDEILYANYKVTFDYNIYICASYTGAGLGFVGFFHYLYVALYEIKTNIFTKIFHAVFYVLTLYQRILPVYYLMIFSCMGVTKYKFINRTIEDLNVGKTLEEVKQTLNVLMETHHYIAACLSGLMQFQPLVIVLNLMYIYGVCTASLAGVFVLDRGTLLSFIIYAYINNAILFVFLLLMQRLLNEIFATFLGGTKTIPPIIAEKRKTGFVLCELDVAYKDTELTTLKKNFLLQLLHDKIDNSPCGLFAIDNSFALTVVSNLSSAVMFIFQLRPELLG